MLNFLSCYDPTPLPFPQVPDDSPADRALFAATPLAAMAAEPAPMPHSKTKVAVGEQRLPLPSRTRKAGR